MVDQTTPQHFGQFSLIGINILTVILAALIFFSVSTWFQVFVRWVSPKQNDDDKANLDKALKLAILWTSCVTIILVIVSLCLGSSVWNDASQWKGHDVSEMLDEMI
ncbi:MAG: hypothetical protein Edafosvirus17_5 [Edafosvirus sp.]|uniref:Uncharacterized protein n=1 Tax=Edafosvirus sp. TaxID=2487765 RepID=A0A3G4ZYP6_9VIRU|nr:MAG: hypothetical protein Edafosvirus17_5 [Edafosvirus sp.]